MKMAKYFCSFFPVLPSCPLGKGEETHYKYYSEFQSRNRGGEIDEVLNYDEALRATKRGNIVQICSEMFRIGRTLKLKTFFFCV